MSLKSARCIIMAFCANVNSCPAASSESSLSVACTATSTHEHVYSAYGLGGSVWGSSTQISYFPPTPTIYQQITTTAASIKFESSHWERASE